VVEDELGATLEERLVTVSRYFPAASRVANAVLGGWRPATNREDWWEGTDLVIVPSDQGVPLAFRLRRFDNVLRYQHTFTIRTKPHPELDKLKAAFYVYGWAEARYGADRAELCAWVLMDIPKMKRAIEAGLPPSRERRNKDGTAFVAYPFRDDFVKARLEYVRSEPEPDVPILHTCHYCGNQVPGDELATLRKDGETYFIHRVPCYTDEVP
jgi:hypothetical protein